MIKRRIYNTVFKGTWRQMVYLAVVCAAVIGIMFCASFFLNGDPISLADIVSMFFSTDSFNQDHAIFRFIVEFSGILLFSSLLISLLTNVISNVRESYRNGHVRYNPSGHILIIGSDPQLIAMLRSFGMNGCREDIVVFTSEDVAKLREKVNLGVVYSNVRDRIVYCKGDMCVKEKLYSVRPWNAKSIFIIGEPSQDEHDSCCLKCLRLIREMTSKARRDIRCVVTLNTSSTVRVLHYMKQVQGSDKLKVDFVPYGEYQAEQLLVKTDFLPAISQGDGRHSHVVILGDTSMALDVAKVVAQVSHYPNFCGGEHRTVITFVAKKIRSFMESMLVCERPLMSLCTWSYVAPDGVVTKNSPDKDYGDFMDIEWQFVDASPTSLLASGLIREWAKDDNQVLSIISACATRSDSVSAVLSLPREVYSSTKVAVYLDGQSELISLSDQTGCFGSITMFGPGVESSDSLFERRFDRGQRVNFIYDQAFCPEKSSNELEAWYRISECNKLSSIYCANYIPMRLRSFSSHEAGPAVYEAEHRRWMTSALLLGFLPMTAEQSAIARSDRELLKAAKSRFQHPDIIPYNDLGEDDKNKDRVIIEATDYILGR